jgi:hypothetical protein
MLFQCCRSLFLDCFFSVCKSFEKVTPLCIHEMYAKNHSLTLKFIRKKPASGAAETLVEDRGADGRLNPASIFSSWKICPRSQKFTALSRVNCLMPHSVAPINAAVRNNVRSPLGDRQCVEGRADFVQLHGLTPCAPPIYINPALDITVREWLIAVVYSAIIKYSHSPLEKRRPYIFVVAFLYQKTRRSFQHEKQSVDCRRCSGNRFLNGYPASDRMR